MLPATIIMLLLAISLSFIAYTREPSLLISGLRSGGMLMIQIVPLLAAAFVVAGLVQVVIPKEFISRWLGEASGWRGIMLGCVAGALTPGGPFISFPIVAAILGAGAGIGTVVSFITAWSLWGVHRLPMEIAIVGPKVAVFRLVSTLVFPPLAGFIAHTFFSRFFN